MKRSSFQEKHLKCVLNDIIDQEMKMKTKHVVTPCGCETLGEHVRNECDVVHLWVLCHPQIFM